MVATHDVFLSYSSKDKAVVHDLAARLRDRGLRVWLDAWELKPGDLIPSRIDDGLEESAVLALCMSEHAFGSDWATLESETFRFRDPTNRERRFIPLRLRRPGRRASSGRPDRSSSSRAARRAGRPSCGRACVTAGASRRT
jgi:hypothetical protein